VHADLAVAHHHRHAPAHRVAPADLPLAAQDRPPEQPLAVVVRVRDLTPHRPNFVGKRFVNLDNGPLRFDGIKDLKDCVDYLIANRLADPKRIGITGGSYGGYMTLVGVTFYPDLFAAAVDLYGMVNFFTFFEQTEPWMAAISTTEYGDPKTQRDLLRDLSPLGKLDRIQTPLMVQHGANDTNVPVVEAEQVVASLKRRGVPVEYIAFPDEGHGFRKEKNRITSTVKMVEFFAAHLGDRP